MRRKSVTILTIVYLALCVSYGMANRNIIPTDDITEIVQSDTPQISTETDTSFLEKIDITSSMIEKESDLAPDSEISSKPEIDTESEENTETEVISQIEEENNTEEFTEQSEPESEENQQQSEPEIVEEIQEQPEIPVEESVIEEQENSVDEEYYIEEQIQQEPAVPTLEEYLEKLRCSGCRHNCSLLSPRCMNGARKASIAESEYYSIYG